MQPAQLTFLMIGQKSDGSGGRAVDKSASAHSRLHNQSYGQLCTSCSEVAGRCSSYSHGQTGGNSRDLGGGVGANLLGRLVFWKVLAGEPGLSAVPSMADVKSLNADIFIAFQVVGDKGGATIDCYD